MMIHEPLSFHQSVRHFINGSKHDLLIPAIVDKYVLQFQDNGGYISRRKTAPNIERKYLLLVLRSFLFNFCPLESQFLLNLCKVNSLLVNLSASTRHQSRDLFSFGIFRLKVC